MSGYSDLSKEQLIEKIKVLKKRKKFGLVWEDKPEDVAEKCRKELPVLVEDERRQILNSETSPTNVLIEGDNYHALSVLNYTHKGKIDVIYADPPYNTGARDWKYNNHYVDKNDQYRHSKWLSLMQKRLRLAKALLKKDGVLIITIDDNELFHLGILLEEIFFSYQKFIITIEHNKRGRRGKNFAVTNEWAIFLVPRGIDRIQEDKSTGMIGGETRNLRRTGSGSKRTERPRKFYPIWVNKKTLKVVRAGDPIPRDAEWKREEKGNLVTIWPIDEEGSEKNWHYGVVRTRKCIELGQLEARVRDYGIQIYYTLRKKDSKKYKTVWTGSTYDASTHGSVLLQKLLGASRKFDYPKSLYAVLQCLRATVGNRKDAVILDFFAGSGTTGHAALLLNKEDQGNRSFILCTNNENKIAEDICFPRIGVAIKGHKDYPDITNFPAQLRYYRTDFVDAEPTDKNKRKLTAQATEMLCLKEGTFQKVIDKRDFKVFGCAGRYTGIIFHQVAIPAFKEAIASLEGRHSIYVFSLSDDTFDDEFEDIKHKVKLSPIPEAILRVYRRIFK